MALKVPGFPTGVGILRDGKLDADAVLSLTYGCNGVVCIKIMVGCVINP